MNRKEFMQRLEYLLQNISTDERQEALQFYEDYFEDAGTDQEQKVISELVSPEHVARTIMDGLQNGSAHGEFTENGYEDSQYRNYQSMAPKQNTQRNQNNAQQGRQPVNHSNRILLIIVLILTLPVTGGILLGAAGTLFGIVVSVVAVTGAFLIAGIALIGAGIAMALTLQIAQAFVLCGVGFLLFAIGIPCLLLTIWLFGKGLPALCKAIYNGIMKILGNGGIAA